MWQDMNIHLVSVRKLNCLSFSFSMKLEKTRVIISPSLHDRIGGFCLLDH